MAGVPFADGEPRCDDQITSIAERREGADHGGTEEGGVRNVLGPMSLSGSLDDEAYVTALETPEVGAVERGEVAAKCCLCASAGLA